MGTRGTRSGTIALAAVLLSGAAMVAPATASAAVPALTAPVDSVLAAQMGPGGLPAPVEAVIALQAEVLVLVELGALPSPPPRLTAIHAEYASFVAGLDREGLTGWLRASDLDGARALDGLRAQGYSVRPETASALAELSAGSWAALAGNGTVDVPSWTYVAALDDLDLLAVTGPSGATPTPTTVPAWAAPPTVPSVPTPTAPPTTAAPVVVPPPTVASYGPDPTPTTMPSPISPAPVLGAGSPASAGSEATASGAGGSAAGGAPVVPASTTTSSTAATTTSAAPRPDAPAATPSAQGDAADDGTPAVDAPTAEERTSPTAEDGGSAKTLGAVVVSAVLAAMLAIGSYVRTRGRTRRSARDVDAVLDAGRRLASMLDLDELGPGMLAETRTLLAAEAAAFVGRDEQAARSADSDARSPSPSADGRRAVERVADTGRSWRGTVVWHDGTPSVAVVASAVMGGGRVQGVLVARRSASRPFQTADQLLLEQLAPLVAAALAAATRHDELTVLTFTDGLTNLANRRQLDVHLRATAAGGTAAREHAEPDRPGERELGIDDDIGEGGGDATDPAAADTVGFIMIDVDHFKSYNDTHGHPAGDELLRRLAELLSSSVRPSDVVYRYGGEEFAVLLPGADERAAGDVGERIRRAVYDADLSGGASQPGGRVTVSVGVAVGAPTEAEQLKGCADQSLYQAKHNGRNRVVIAAVGSS